MSLVRGAMALLVLALALILQVSLFPAFAWQGVVPNLALLVVVASALVRGPEFAATLGFVAGAMIDLAPPADHVAGRWALALLLVGFIAGKVRPDTRPSASAVVPPVAAASFICNSIFAPHRPVPSDPVHPLPAMSQAVLLALLWGGLPHPLL